MSAREAFFLLYVAGQERATAFYRAVLGMEPALDVPGITEFLLREGTYLCLMPEAGARKLLGTGLPDPEAGRAGARAEVYLRVENPGVFHARALAAGARELSPMAERGWGDLAAYSLDPDGHVLAFAEKAPGK